MQSVPPVGLAELRNVAEQAALKAGKLVHRKWNEPRQISQKGYRDFVTDSDFASQALIAGIVRDKFPDHGFLTEEDDPSLPVSGPVIWIVDPVDGTTNYSRQVPTYCISIAAAIRDQSTGTGQQAYKPVVGVIYDPMRDELFSATADSCSTLNGQEVSVSTIDNLGDAIISLDWSRDYGRRQTMLSVLSGCAHDVRTIRSTGSASLSLAWVAAGRVDVYFNFGVGPWDVAAAAVIIRQAGGIVTDMAGKTWSPSDVSCMAANKLIHAPFLAQAALKP